MLDFIHSTMYNSIINKTNKSKEIYIMKIYNAHKDELQGYQQAINRYNLLLKELENETKLNVSQQETLDALEEMKEISEQLEQGEPVWDIEAKAFVEDINQLWEAR